MAHYLVTGGAGFIGSHLAEELVRRGTRVRVADSLVTGKRSNLDHISRRRVPRGRPRRSRRSRDGRRRHATTCCTRRRFRRCRARSSDPITSNRANVDAHAERAASRRATPASSAWSSPARRRRTATRRRCRSTRTCRPNPLSPYALQKLVGEQYLQMFTRLYGLETVTIRYFNVFGPRQDPVLAVLRRHLGVRDGAARRAGRRPSTATASRPATSPTSPTSSTACCARARRRARAAK